MGNLPAVVMIEFVVRVPGGQLPGRVAGQGPRVLLVHGGPGLSMDYLRPLAEELASGYEVALYQQRGTVPATLAGPFDLPRHTADLSAVLDALGWDEVILVGHSWGVVLLVTAAIELGQRLRGALAVDPLGLAETESWSQFNTNLAQAVRPADRTRFEELAAVPDDEATGAESAEMLSILWPGYFPDPAAAPPVPGYWRLDEVSRQPREETWQSTELSQGALADQLASITLPFTFLHSMAGPMPLIASSAAVGLMPDAVLERLDDAGHFPWLDRPGAVRAA